MGGFERVRTPGIQMSAALYSVSVVWDFVVTVPVVGAQEVLGVVFPGRGSVATSFKLLVSGVVESAVGVLEVVVCWMQNSLSLPARSCTGRYR